VDAEPSHAAGAADDRRPAGPSLPAKLEDPGLKESAAEWLAVRVELFRLEARDAAKTAAKRGAVAGFLAGMAVFAWALLMAGLVGWISAGTGLAWYWAAIIVAGGHAAAATAAGFWLSRSGTPVFEATRSELEKDRQWLEDLRRRIKS